MLSNNDVMIVSGFSIIKYGSKCSKFTENLYNLIYQHHLLFVLIKI